MRFSEYISGQSSQNLNEGLIDSIKGFFKKFFAIETPQEKIRKAAQDYLKANAKANVVRVVERVYEFSDWAIDIQKELLSIAKRYNFDGEESKFALAIKVPKSIESRIEGYLTKDKDLDLDNWEPTQDEINEIKEWFRPGQVGISVAFELKHSGSFKTQDYLKLAKEVEKSFKGYIKGDRKGGGSNRLTSQEVEVAVKDGSIFGVIKLENS